MKKREVWVDNVKVIACILVVLGHFFQSMLKAEVISDNDLYRWFNQSIYYFHVPLFFICSGYLYEKLSGVEEVRSYGHNILKKLLNLGIPYFTFSIITLILKMAFDKSVNSGGSEGFFNTLFLDPVAPYWYLYALFFIFVVTPTAKSKKRMTGMLIISLIMKVISIIWADAPLLYAIGIVLTNEIWFVIGMAIFKFDLKNKINLKTVGVGAIFIPLTIVLYKLNLVNLTTSFLGGLLGCMLTISIIYIIFKDNIQNKAFAFAAKYTMPIFLMHTIFSAGIRAVLMKIGLSNSIAQIGIGLAVSFIGPVIAAIIMEKSKYLNIFLYPSKLIRI